MGTESKTLTHWKKCFNKDYMGTWSLPDGRDMVVTIVRVEKSEIKGEGGRIDIRPIMFFKEFKEPMVLNATNGKTIHKLLDSPYVENWYGHRIQLYAESGIKIGKGANAETTDGLRVRPFLPKSNEEAEKSAIRGRIRALLGDYKGSDIEVIKSELNTKTQAKEDTVQYLTSVENKLKA